MGGLSPSISDHPPSGIYLPYRGAAIEAWSLPTSPLALHPISAVPNTINAARITNFFMTFSLALRAAKWLDLLQSAY